MMMFITHAGIAAGVGAHSVASV